MPACYRPWPWPWQWRGRIGRVRFAAYCFPVFLLFLLLLYLVNTGMSGLPHGVPQDLVCFMAPVLLSMVPAGRRLNDMGLPWPSVLVLPAAVVFAPDVALTLLYCVLFLYPGERQPNRFGAPACPNSVATFAGAGLWLVLAGAAAWFLYSLLTIRLPLPPKPHPGQAAAAVLDFGIRQPSPLYL